NARLRSSFCSSVMDSSDKYGYQRLEKFLMPMSQLRGSKIYDVLCALARTFPTKVVPERLTPVTNTLFESKFAFPIISFSLYQVFVIYMGKFHQRFLLQSSNTKQKLTSELP